MGHRSWDSQNTDSIAMSKLICFQGVRTVESDACSSHDPCLNGGECVSTDAGPLCDCDSVDFESVTHRPHISGNAVPVVRAQVMGLPKRRLN